MRTGTSTRGTLILLSAVIALLIAGCGGAGGANPDPSATDPTCLDQSVGGVAGGTANSVRGATELPCPGATDPPDSGQPVDTEAPGSATTDPGATDQSDVGRPADTGATITVGSETWEFELTDVYPGGCYLHPDGVASGGAVDGDFSPTGVFFDAHDLTPDGGYLEVETDATGEQWMAAADRATMTTFHLLPDGVSQIDTITIDGARIWGTATFIEKTAAAEAIATNSSLPASVTGSFDIQCSN
jgi:hypothetical protein